MRKAEYREVLRKKLQAVPIDIRQSWKDIDLLGWWAAAKSEDSYLIWERASGSPWQHVKSMCSDLIGRNAIY